jgi:ABC-type transporter Mla maintaining outer membrane lipid asymmetry ATPase subunit MlaF
MGQSDSGGGEKEGRPNLLVPHIVRWRKEDGPIIEMRNVWKRYGDKEVLRGLNLVVPTGSTTVIMGESGSGKSVLLRHIMGLEHPDEGEVIVFGKDLSKLSGEELLQQRKRVGVLFQNYALMDSMTVRDNIAFPVEQNSKITEAELDGRVKELLELLELPHAYKLFPSELSGGMKKRVSLARALIYNAEMVLFDEPTTGLDPVMIEFVDSLIIKARQAYDITSVIISHDVGSVSRLGDQVAMLSGGQIVQSGSFAQIQASTHPWVSQFVNVGGSGRMKSSAVAGEQHEEGLGPICDDIPRRMAAEVDEPVVHLIDLWKSFGDRTILKGITMKIPPRKITVIIGGSGSGKSVVVKHIIGLFQPSKGEVKVFGNDVARAQASDIAKLRERFGMLFQNAALFDSMTVRQNVGFPLLERRLAKGRELEDRVQEVMEKLHIASIGGRFPSEVSSGQRKRVALARALITKPDIMIYDEPTTGQDPVMIRNVDNMIEEVQSQFDITSIVISHDMVSTFRIADRIAMIYYGELLSFGTPDEMKQTQREDVRKFIFAGSA